MKNRILFWLMQTFFPLGSYFSLLVQKKSNQKKAHPAFAPFALRAKGSFDQRNFLTRHPCRGKKRRTSLCVALTGVLRCSHRCGRGRKAGFLAQMKKTIALETNR